MKKILLICLVATIMLTGGCSYSVSHSRETSVGVDSNGKVDANASTAVYTERVEDGKTVNHKASASVGSKGASAGVNQATASSSEEGISFTIEDADLRKGEAEIIGHFTNDGSKSVKISKIYISFEFCDEKGKKIWEDASEIDNLNLVVNPGAKTPANFVITNPKAPRFDGSFDLKYHMEYNS